ncbi:high mobility group B protein 6 [Prosopis cineraria]|uniref:high mobility group B protein 6 n=1 Tax=Prosopis cineraria TaxID=364024 RepID=UPI00240EBBF2|nr:high mobility group B protein 6 [Prosopis cineraria]
MAEISAEVSIDQIPSRKQRSRRALKDKNLSANDAKSLTKKLPDSSTPQVSKESDAGKENQPSVSQLRSSPKKGRAASKKQSKQSLEKDFQEMQEMMQKLRLEKEQTEELLKVKDDILKQKEEELDERGREQEKLQTELKKLQKLKEFKPIMNLPMLRDKEQEKKDNKKKNGCAVKRPSPPYILWSKDQWAEIKKANPEAEFKDISNMLGAKWKTVSEEEKQPYEEKYLIEKEAYLRVITKEKRESEAMKLLEEEQKQKTAMELLEQYMQFKQETEKESKKSRKEKDPLKPKHPVSAFILYTNDRRAAILADNKSILEVSKIVGDEWKNLTEDQKRPYEEIAKKNREKYIQDMEAYKQKKDEEAANLRKEEEEQMKLQKEEALKLLKKKEKTENLIKKSKKKKQNKEDKNCDPNKPKRPPSSFLLFSKEARRSIQEERPGMNNSNLNALISVKWKELSEGERKVWNDKAAEAMEAYKKELEEYNKSIAAKLDQ